MPKANCPQSDSWCPHHDQNVCQPYNKGINDLCVHVRPLLASRMALQFLTQMTEAGKIRAEFRGMEPDASSFEDPRAFGKHLPKRSEF